jgi:hypothetical protein
MLKRDFKKPWRPQKRKTLTPARMQLFVCTTVSEVPSYPGKQSPVDLVCADKLRTEAVVARSSWAAS